ncbi:MAG: DUF3047 domain-containing protein [Candidatus Omnitrophica bacterium]|nr:DUF3047 domain-containing protein [Candidatus Omnitrophota bacterium]
MKPRARTITIIFLTGTIILSIAGISFLLLSKLVEPIKEKFGLEDSFLFRRRAVSGITEKQTVKNFSFSSPDAIKEWEQKPLAKNFTEYSVAEVDGKKCIKGVSDNSASVLFYKERLSYIKRPFITWYWKAIKFPDMTKKENIQLKDEYDFAMQLYVVFYDKFFLKTKAIQYIWTKETPVGTAVNSPYTPNVKLLALQSGLSDGWKFEDRDIVKDYKDLFGVELKKDVVAIAVMTDADSTGTTAEACFADVTIGYLGMLPLDGEKTGSEGPEVNYTVVDDAQEDIEETETSGEAAPADVEEITEEIAEDDTPGDLEEVEAGAEEKVISEE